MSIRNAVVAGSFEALIGELTDALGAQELYVLSHDLASLHSLSNPAQPSIFSESLLDSLLGGTAAEHDGVIFVPIMSRRFPLLAATGLDETANLDDIDIVGPITDFHREFLESVEHRRRAEPFTPAAQLQWSLLPVRAAIVGDIEVAGALQPAASVAGDAYDFAVTPAGALTVLVMDAMGHGVTATLATSLALAAMRTSRRAAESLASQVRAADQAIWDEYDGDRFVTMAAMEITSDHVLVVNAGHEPIRRISAAGHVETLEMPADPPLGLDGLSDYRVHRLDPLGRGEAFVLLSDGASEARDAHGVEFGETRVNQALGELRGPAALQTADRLGRAIQRYIPDKLNDDLTTVVVQRSLP